jgi:hypothetical protein
MKRTLLHSVSVALLVAATFVLNACAGASGHSAGSRPASNPVVPSVAARETPAPAAESRASYQRPARLHDPVNLPAR